MNQLKIGRFIAECRKNKNLTQQELADKLGITYKAISKWECGKGLPDASIMVDLCNTLDITVNELLTGEKITDKNYIKQAEKNLIELKTSKELTTITARICHIITIILLLILNFINVAIYGVEEAINKPEFIIMNIRVVRKLIIDTSIRTKILTMIKST